MAFMGLIGGDCTRIGDQVLHLDEFLGKAVGADVMFFKTDVTSGCLADAGFRNVEIIERDPCPGVEYPSQRAYVFAGKPYDMVGLGQRRR